MSTKYFRFRTILSMTGVLIVLASLAMPAVAYADGPIPTPNNGTCITCHDDLYYLHDTGNRFCLNESPMACVDSHGGNPNTLNKVLAHTQRATHPIINDDVTMCQQCHPEKCFDRVEFFDQAASISNVLVAAPYPPAYSTAYDGFIPVTNAQQEPGFLDVFTVTDGQIVGRETRPKANHNHFTKEDKEHSHEQGHGTDLASQYRHNAMIETINDCQVLIVRGMGMGSY